MAYDLEDRVVFITGASSGIGRECAIEYHRAGSRVVAAARSKDRLETLAAQVGGDRIAPVTVDVTDEEQREAALRFARQRFGPIDVLVNDVGLDTLSAHVKKSLKGIKVACYYGCQMVRPYATFDDQENPMTMDRLIQALGAETLDWPLKTRCCGGTFTGTIQDIGLELNHVLLKEAKKRGADVIATNCSLCQFNLECYQNKIHRKFKDHEYLPVVYFTQLIGMALGLPKKDIGLHRLFIPFKLK